MPRAFILGNGPSLAKTNLELLKDEVTFAVNRIHFIYDKTTWRPTYYVRGEEVSFKSAAKYHQEVQLHLDLGCNVWVNAWYTGGTDMRDRINRIISCHHYKHHFYELESPHGWHLPKICSFGSSVNIAVQIAVQEGYKPIYLLGCDLGYQDGKPSHFDPDYEKDIQEDLRPARLANLDTLAAHMVAARSSPVKIYNATIGGELEVYERVNYNELF